MSWGGHTSRKRCQRVTLSLACDLTLGEIRPPGGSSFCPPKTGDERHADAKGQEMDGSPQLEKNSHNHRDQKKKPTVFSTTPATKC